MCRVLHRFPSKRPRKTFGRSINTPYLLELGIQIVRMKMGEQGVEVVVVVVVVVLAVVVAVVEDGEETEMEMEMEMDRAIEVLVDFTLELLNSLLVPQNQNSSKRELA